MRFWKRRKKAKEQPEAKQNIEDVLEHLNTRGAYTDSAEYKRQAEHEMLGRCEEIIEAIRELEEAKSEYRIVTDYLNDIQKIRNIPKETQEDLHEVAGNVAKLNKARDQYLNTAQKISDAQFVQMQQEEDEIPDAIRRLEANEAYEAAIRRDMNYLEGEKQAWVYCMEEVKEEMHHLRIFSYVLFGVFIVLMAVILVLQGVKNVDTKLMFTLLVSAAAIGGFFLYFRQQRDIDQLKRCEANINGAIILLNKIKFKYVNTKNAVDYACEKYHVHNSKELTYIWEQYQDAVREKEKYLQTNEELDYYNSRLVRRLKDYQLYDAKVWTGNPEAIYNEKEMVEVQHNLIARRQKLRERIEYNTKNILNMRKEVEEIAASQKQMVPELKEIIDSNTFGFQSFCNGVGTFLRDSFVVSGSTSLNVCITGDSYFSIRIFIQIVHDAVYFTQFGFFNFRRVDNEEDVFCQCFNFYRFGLFLYNRLRFRLFFFRSRSWSRFIINRFCLLVSLAKLECETYQSVELPVCITCFL